MGSYYLMGIEFLFEKVKKLLKWIVVMFAHNVMGVLNATEFHT